VAERKVDGLLEAGARVTVVSPRLTDRLARLAGEGRLDWVPSRYRHGDLAGAALAFVAVGDAAVTRAVAEEARDLGIWVNAADDPARSDAVLPAVVRRGDLVVAVGTGGASPALAGAVRDEIAAFLPADYAALTDLAREVRADLRRHGRSADGEAWRGALGADLRVLLAEGRHGEAARRLRERLGA
jgi:siroheme synthase-like protein